VPALVLLSPLFWFMELLQNQLYWLVLRRPGWVYPGSPYQWFYFPSMLLWTSAIASMWTLDRLVFIPRRTPPLRRVLLLGLVEWAGEWVAGCLGHALGRDMQVWPGAPLVYVGVSAYAFWCLDVLAYDWLGRFLTASPGI